MVLAVVRARDAYANWVGQRGVCRVIASKTDGYLGMQPSRVGGHGESMGVRQVCVVYKLEYVASRYAGYPVSLEAWCGWRQIAGKDATLKGEVTEAPRGLLSREFVEALPNWGAGERRDSLTARRRAVVRNTRDLSRIG